LTVELVFAACIGVGLAAASGMRVFLPLLVLGLGARSGWVPVGDDFAWVATTPALVALSCATLFEVGAYYVPWLDHVLDVGASPTAVGAGVFATAAVLGDADPFLRWALALVAGGGAAATVQATSVAARATSGATTLGLANPLVSTLEWVGALLTSLAALLAGPLVVVLLLVGVLWVGRALRRRWATGRGAQRPGG